MKLMVNSVGCRREECRPAFLKQLETGAETVQQELCPECQRKVHTNPLRIFDCKNPHCIEISNKFPVMLDRLCGECKTHFDQVKAFLTVLGANFQVNPRMVRGLDYYTKTAFEITSGQLGAQDAILGGGRYDNLVKELGGPGIPGIGFAAGLERIILHVETVPGEKAKIILAAYQNETLEQQAVKLAKTLWEKGITAHISYDTHNMKKQFKRGDRIGADFTFILGEEEIQSDTISIKNMKTQEQFKIKNEELDQWLKNNL
jgi:histidyl-tRNA synthetase